MGSWDLKRDEQFALTNATTYARVRRYRTAVHRADAITFINFPAALLLPAWIPRRSHFDDLRARAADIRAICRQRNHPVATDILLRKCRDALARLISKCAFNTGRAWPLQHDGRKRNSNGIAETIRLRTGDLAGPGVAFGSGIAIKKLQERAECYRHRMADVSEKVVDHLQSMLEQTQMELAEERLATRMAGLGGARDYTRRSRDLPSHRITERGAAHRLL